MRLPVALCFLLTACGGSDTKSGADAPSVDGVPTPDRMPSGDTTFTVLENGQPAPGIYVIVHDSSGSPTATLTTTSDGTVSFDAPDSAMVTVIAGADLTTFVAINNGDKVTHEIGFGQTADLGIAKVKMQEPPDTTNITRALNGCEEWGAADWSTTVELDIREDCVTTNGMHVLGVAYGPLATVLAFSHSTDIPLDPSGETDVNLPAWHTNFNDFSFGISGGNLGETNGFQAWQMHDGVAFRAPSKTGNTQLRTIQVASSFAEALRYQMLIPQGAPSPSGTKQAKMFYGKQFDISGTSEIFDMSSEMLPAITSVSVDNANQERFKLSWTTSGSLAQTDGVIARTRFFAGGEIRWAFVAPPQTTSVTAPKLPAEFSSLTPAGADTPYVVAAESSLIAGWQEFKQTGSIFITGPKFTENTSHTIRGAVFFPSF